MILKGTMVFTSCRDFTKKCPYLLEFRVGDFYMLDMCEFCPRKPLTLGTVPSSEPYMLDM